MIEWLNGNGWWLIAASAGMFLCGIGIMFALAVLMPADHFTRPHTGPDHVRQHPVLRVVLRVTKNVVGVILLAAGLVMAIPMVPGPGVLFILLGLSLTEIPGKPAAARYGPSASAVPGTLPLQIPSPRGIGLIVQGRTHTIPRSY